MSKTTYTATPEEIFAIAIGAIGMIAIILLVIVLLFGERKTPEQKQLDNFAKFLDTCITQEYTRDECFDIWKGQ